MAIAKLPTKEENAYLAADVQSEPPAGKLVLKGFRVFEDDFARLEKLARRRRAKPAYLMRLAMRQFLDREESEETSHR